MPKHFFHIQITLVTVRMKKEKSLVRKEKKKKKTFSQIDAAIDHGHGVTYTNSFDNYDTKPVTYESYGPPKSTVSHIEQPHAIYGTPEYNGEN